MASYLQIENLTKSYGDRMLFSDVTFGVNEGDKIGLIAKNGMGKTTLLRCIAGIEGVDSGKVTFRNDLKIGFLEQTPDLDENLSVLETCIADSGRVIDAITTYEQALESGDIDALTRANELMDASQAWDYEDRLKQMLSQLGIVNLTQRVSQLSGGQKKRVALAKVILENPDLIILDEPTNHLDMKTKDILKQAIKDFDGTVIVVSHDREFLDGLVEKVYEFGGGKVRECLGGIYEFLEKKKISSLRELELSQSPGTGKQQAAQSKQEEQAQPQPQKSVAPDMNKASQPDGKKLSYAEQREREKMLRKAAKKVEEAEKRIAEIEAEIADIEARIAAGETDNDIFSKHQEKNRELENTMSVWELASMELDELKSRFA